MPDDTSGVHGAAAGRIGAPHELSLAAAEADNPEWAPWLRLVGRAADQPPWTVEIGLAPERHASAPVLDDAVLSLDAARARTWLGDLLGEASQAADTDRLGDAALLASEALAVLEGAIALDGDRLDGLAAMAGADPAALSAIAHVAASPILRACHARLTKELPQPWTQGYCQVCGAWPAFAEVIGLQRERRLRCGRCASGWRFDVLLCPFCGERDHGKLTGLVVEGKEEMMRVDTCRTCGGYVKSLGVLLPTPDDKVALLDAQTVELDLAAADRGCARPESPAVVMRVTLVDRTSGPERNGDGRRWVLS